MMYFDLYLPYAVKISDCGNISVIPNPYWIDSKENTEYRQKMNKWVCLWEN